MTPKWFAGSDLGYGELNGTQIFDERDYVVAVTIGDVPSLDSKTNAALIVRAVNSHAAMKAALEELIFQIAGDQHDAAEIDKAFGTKLLGAAITRARRALTEA